MAEKVSGQHGHTLIEVATVVAIIGSLVIVAVPSFSTMQKRAAVRVAAKEIRSAFHAARSQAITTGRATALKFHDDGQTWLWNLYEDGDWDGVRTADIKKGIDRRISGPNMILSDERRIRISMPDFALPDPDTNKPLGPGGTPVRFGKSKICSFSPRGSSSSGTIFMTDGYELAAAVRVYGATARIRTMIYDPKHGTWGPK
ncbi:MAG: prepilin-type N-terminal cleavage/methylation domain-containing protein [Acidobacteria bacterium]|nr:prepilin-type N-terminal cleavage/methylation domain-containing protein [Acidobacteriota bacterium]